MYADDTHITYADVDVNSIQLNLNHDLGKLKKWLTSNKLTLNTANTEFTLIGSRQKLSTLSSKPQLSIDNVPIEKVTSVKSLGIFTDEIYGGKRTSINYLKRSLPGYEQLKELEILFQCQLSIVYTTFSFNLNSIIVNIVWGNCGKTLFDRLQKFQNQIRFQMLLFSHYLLRWPTTAILRWPATAIHKCISYYCILYLSTQTYPLAVRVYLPVQ